MAKTYSYQIENNLYINLTNKCSNACTFCVRNGKDSYYGNSLWLDKEPTVQEVIDSIDFTKSYNEIVFCGFGEPTYRINELVELAKYFKSKGYKTRLNTNGQGNLINNKDITVMLKGVIDLVNVSLNMPNKIEYQKICVSKFGEQAFDALIDFAVGCKNNNVNVCFSVVDCIGAEKVEMCKKLAEQVKIPLRVREFISDS